jgi:riboflavin kinase/FMN adenylyltransferase
VHIFDIDEGLYGQRLRVEFIRRQRGERRFADAKSLIRQMDRDASRARAILTDAHARL